MLQILSLLGLCQTKNKKNHNGVAKVSIIWNDNAEKASRHVFSLFKQKFKNWKSIPN